MTKTDYAQVHVDAVKAGLRAAQAARPTPMVVQQHAHAFDDDSPVVKEWVVEGGVCGFAWVTVGGNTGFGRWLRSSGMFESDARFGTASRARAEADGIHWGKGYPTGYSGWVWVGGQSLTIKEAYARAYAEVLQAHGIKAYAGSRLD